MGIAVQAFADNHVPAIITACHDWQELAQYGPPYWRPRGDAELRRKIAVTAGPQPSTEYNFVISDEGSLVGECSIHAIDWRSRVAQVGICIWRPEHRNKGYGRAAVTHLIDWSAGYLGLARLEAWIVDGNERSIWLFERLGFAHEGTLRDRYLHGGVRRDMHVMALMPPSPA